jgi:hypothetical protein
MNFVRLRSTLAAITGLLRESLRRAPWKVPTP